MSDMKPSLTEYSDTLRVFQNLDELAPKAEGLSADSLTKIGHVAHAIRHAEESALRDRSSMLAKNEPGQGTDAWQKANAQPFVVAARQAKILLEDEGFTKELANSSIVVVDSNDHMAVSQSRDYESMTQGFALVKKATDVATLLNREETAKGHPMRERAVGRYAISFDKSPFQPAGF